MNILITGVNGFIGTALWNYFKAHKFPLKVFGIDIRLRSSTPHLSACDLSNPRQLRKILDRVKPNVIFHLAGGRPADENILWQVNFILTKRLLDVIGEFKGISPCIVIPGSAAEYGRVTSPQKPAPESLQPEPLGWYGFVKYMQTSLGLMYAHKGLNVRNARIFNICGYGTLSSLALGNFAEKSVRIERGKELPVLKVGQLSGRRILLILRMFVPRFGPLPAKANKGKCIMCVLGNLRACAFCSVI